MFLARITTLGRKQSGDTLVEVLISVAIVSVVLASGYAVTTQGLRTTQDANERSQGLELVQQQVELLRVYNGGSSLTGVCLDSSGTPKPSATSTECNVTPTGSTVCATSFCYNLDIEGNGIYQVTAKWKNQRGTDATVTMVYEPAS
jgi:prepilin-type N-terminal cleavage/methylation domain-containing protein